MNFAHLIDNIERKSRPINKVRTSDLFLASENYAKLGEERLHDERERHSTCVGVVEFYLPLAWPSTSFEMR